MSLGQCVPDEISRDSENRLLYVAESHPVEPSHQQSIPNAHLDDPSALLATRTTRLAAVSVHQLESSAARNSCSMLCEAQPSSDDQ